MKKIVMALAILAMAAAADSAKAGQCAALSDQEWAEIEKIARSAYPRGVNVQMTTTDEWFCVYTTVEFFTQDGRQYIKINVYPAHAYAVIRQIGSKEMDATAEKIKAGIEAVLNKSAHEALER